VALATAVVGTLVWLHDWPVHHFGVVEEGVLYRGGQPDARALAYIIRRYKIRTVVNLRGPSPQEDWWHIERQVCQKHGVRMVDVSVSSYDTTVSGLKLFLATATDPVNCPVYVHCEAGSARTGYAVAAYRIAVQGWSYEQATDEARGFHFNPEVKLSREYDRILRELAGGLDWQKLPNAAVARRRMTAMAGKLLLACISPESHQAVWSRNSQLRNIYMQMPFQNSYNVLYTCAGGRKLRLGNGLRRNMIRSFGSVLSPGGTACPIF
jgi:hypothetical protein